MFCDKCGAMLKENMEFCDKCGAKLEFEAQPDSAVNENLSVTDADEWTSEAEQTEAEPPEKSKAAFSSDDIAEVKPGVMDRIKEIIPGRMLSKEDKTFRFVGMGSMAIIAILYIINFFLFLDDISYPIGMGTEALGADIGASPVWMLIYWFFTLTPAVVCVLAIRAKKYPLWMICTGAFYVLLTVLTFGIWISFVPNTLLMALTHYDGMNKFAWYVLVDCLSEMWYLKLLFFALGFFSLYMDRQKLS